MTAEITNLLPDRHEAPRQAAMIDATGGFDGELPIQSAEEDVALGCGRGYFDEMEP